MVEWQGSPYCMSRMFFEGVKPARYEYRRRHIEVACIDSEQISLMAFACIIEQLSM